MAMRQLLVVVGLVLVSSWAPVAQSQNSFATRLDTVPINFSSQAATTGSGSVSAELDGSELSIEGSFDGLASAATVAWLHVGAVIGARGPAAHQLAVTQSSRGTVTATVRLSRRELEALNAGRIYLQIHSQSAPEGNLWGWLLPKE
jgi:hypothetical protein